MLKNCYVHVQLHTYTNTHTYIHTRMYIYFVYHNLPKIGPSPKIGHPSFLKKVVAKGAFLLKVCPPIYAVAHAVVLTKNH